MLRKQNFQFGGMVWHFGIQDCSQTGQKSTFLAKGNSNHFDFGIRSDIGEAFFSSVENLFNGIFKKNIIKYDV